MASSWTPGSSPSDGMDAPYNQPQDNDWDVRTPRLSPEDNTGGPTNGANGLLKAANGKTIGLFVNDITTDFNLAGSIAQSQNKQQFFARNYAAPRIMISGQAPNAYEYGRLSEVVRASHQYAIDDGDTGLSDQFRAVTFILFGKKNAHLGGPYETAGIDIKKRTGERSRTTKGKHSRIVLDGYITFMERGAERFLTAYDWQFEFVVLRAANMIGLPDSSLNQELVKSVQTIEDALVNAPSVSPTVDPWQAYGDAGQGPDE